MLMLGGGEAWESYVLRSASSVLAASAKRAAFLEKGAERRNARPRAYLITAASDSAGRWKCGAAWMKTGMG